MGFRENNEDTVKAHSLSQVYTNEANSIKKIADIDAETTKRVSNDGKESEMIYPYKNLYNWFIIDPLQPGDFDLGDMTEKVITNKNGNEIRVFNSDKGTVLAYSLDKDTRVGIFYKPEAGKITYCVKSSEHIGELATIDVRNNSLSVYPNFLSVDLSSETIDGATTLRDMIANSIKDSSELGKYSDTVINAFDEILCLDEEQQITPFTPEQLRIMELERENAKLRVALRDSKEENVTLGQKNESLEKQNEEQSKRIGSLENELGASEEKSRGLSDVIQAMMARVSKIPFVGKKIIGEMQTKLPPASEPIKSDNKGNTFRQDLIDSAKRGPGQEQGKVQPESPTTVKSSDGQEPGDE